MGRHGMQTWRSALRRAAQCVAQTTTALYTGARSGTRRARHGRGRERANGSYVVRMGERDAPKCTAPGLSRAPHCKVLRAVDGHAQADMTAHAHTHSATARAASLHPNHNSRP
jgi:hypothetical protein